MRSYKQSLDLVVWSHCYLEHACLPAPFCPVEFNTAADAILAHLGMSRADITISNAKSVYLHLRDVILSC